MQMATKLEFKHGQLDIADKTFLKHFGYRPRSRQANAKKFSLTKMESEPKLIELDDVDDEEEDDTCEGQKTLFTGESNKSRAEKTSNS